MKYKRVLLKLSGESIGGKEGKGIDESMLSQYSKDIFEIVSAGVEVAVVIGGGNIFRGLTGTGKDFYRERVDKM